MNERIQGLARQADPEYTGNADDDMGNALVGNEAIEKFAELIVRECIDICYNHPARMPSNNWQGVTVPLDIVHRLEEHFGVER